MRIHESIYRLARNFNINWWGFPEDITELFRRILRCMSPTNTPISLWNCMRLQNVYYTIIEKEMEVLYIEKICYFCDLIKNVTDQKKESSATAGDEIWSFVIC